MKISLGEALARRKLKRRSTAGDTVHGYVSGQHAAILIGMEDAVVSYVDRGGAVCIIPCELVHGDWFHRGVMIRATQNFAADRTLPKSRALTELEIRAIQSALKKKAPVQPGQD